MTEAGPDDDALVIALTAAPAARDRALSALFRRYGGRFGAYLRRRGVAESDCEDLVQDAFLRLLRRAPTFKPEGRGQAWIWAVARSAWADAARRQRPLQAMVALDDLAETAAGVTPDIAQVADFQDCVQTQLARFVQDRPEAGQALLWAAVDGMSSAEIAGLLGRSAGATREFLSQARKRLRGYLAICQDG